MLENFQGKGIGYEKCEIVRSCIRNSNFSGHKCVYNSIFIHIAWFNDLRNNKTEITGNFHPQAFSF